MINQSIASCNLISREPGVNLSNIYEYPLYLTRISAGFPSPADDYSQDKLDLNKHLISNSAATFFLRATGEAMVGAGIYSGDLMIVDRSISPSSGKIVIISLDGSLIVRRLWKTREKPVFRAENPLYSDLEAEKWGDWLIWGVVTSVIHYT